MVCKRGERTGQRGVGGDTYLNDDGKNSSQKDDEEELVAELRACLKVDPPVPAAVPPPLSAQSRREKAKRDLRVKVRDGTDDADAGVLRGVLDDVPDALARAAEKVVFVGVSLRWLRHPGEVGLSGGTVHGGGGPVESGG